MRIPAQHDSTLFALAMLMGCLSTNLTAGDFANRDFRQTENSSHWVCDYTRGAHDVLMLRCDNLKGLLYDHMMLKEGPRSKTTQFIPIWRRADDDVSAINLANIVLCKEAPDCQVEMIQEWAANERE